MNPEHPSMYDREDNTDTTVWNPDDTRGYTDTDYAPSTEPTPPLLSDLYDVKGLAIEFAIITVVAATVMGLVAAVADLVLAIISGWLGGDYTAMTSATAYTVAAGIFAVAIILAAVVYLLLDAKVNDPGQVWGWLSVGIPGLLIAVLLLTALSTGTSIYPAAFITFVVVAGSVFIGSFVPTRVTARRAPAWAQLR